MVSVVLVSPPTKVDPENVVSYEHCASRKMDNTLDACLVLLLVLVMPVDYARGRRCWCWPKLAAARGARELCNSTLALSPEGSSIHLSTRLHYHAYTRAH